MWTCPWGVGHEAQTRREPWQGRSDHSQRCRPRCGDSAEAGLCKATDHELIGVCQAEQRCLVTLDVDFGNPLVFDPAGYSGIVVLRLPPRAAHEDIIDACRTLVAGLERGDIGGRLWIVQRGRVREYQGEDRP